jgi:hypothetical protein
VNFAPLVPPFHGSYRTAPLIDRDDPEVREREQKAITRASLAPCPRAPEFGGGDNSATLALIRAIRELVLA